MEGIRRLHAAGGPRERHRISDLQRGRGETGARRVLESRARCTLYKRAKRVAVSVVVTTKRENYFAQDMKVTSGYTYRLVVFLTHIDSWSSITFHCTFTSALRTDTSGSKLLRNVAAFATRPIHVCTRMLQMCTACSLPLRRRCEGDAAPAPQT